MNPWCKQPPESIRPIRWQGGIQLTVWRYGTQRHARTVVLSQRKPVAKAAEPRTRTTQLWRTVMNVSGVYVNKRRVVR